MRSSFGGGSGGMRSVQRAVRAGVGSATPEPFSSSSANSNSARKPTTTNNNNNFTKKKSNQPNTALTLSSSSSSTGKSTSSGSSAFSSIVKLPYSAPQGWGSGEDDDDDDDLEWECVDGSQEGSATVFYEELVFGNVPSTDEVNHAVSAIQQVLGPTLYANLPKENFAEDSDNDSVYEVTSPMSFEKRISSDDSEVDWVEPSMHLYNSRMLAPRGSDRVYDAFHLLQTEPSVQRMVISLSSDKAVWDAVMNNELVKELRGSIEADNQRLERESTSEGSGDSNPVKDIMSWVFVNAKEKIMQLIDHIAKYMNEVFQSPNEDKKEGTSDFLEERLKTSLFLSVIVLIIVVVTRAQSA